VTADPEAAAPNVLDPAQLVRIEATHRGFLFQHLYVVACLLSVGELAFDALLVETDEDIEIRLSEETWYIQVKSRQEPLSRSDIRDALERFDAIRDTHDDGTRAGKARFALLANAEPSPSLARDIDSSGWPADVFVVTPNTPAGRPRPPIDLPPPHASNADAAAWCADRAGTIPFGRLAGSTLVYKLVGVVQLACTGSPPFESHRFDADDVNPLFEQVIIQLQDFPAVPIPYRVLDAEPDFSSGVIQIVTGLSGSGKTLWAAQAAVRAPHSVVYFDTTGTQPGNLPSGLAREIAGRLLPANPEAIASAFLPGESGTDSLRALSLIADQNQSEVTVVVDNIQTATTGDIRSVIAAAPSFRFVLLAQPDPEIAALAAHLGVRPVALEGWAISTIADECSAAGFSVDPAQAQRIRQITGGLPLYVRAAAETIQREYRGDPDAYVLAIERAEHFGARPQHQILAATFATIGEEAKRVSVALALCTVPLAPDEIFRLGSDLGIERQDVAASMTELASRGALVILGDGAIQIHDAFRGLALASPAADSAFKREAALKLRAVLLAGQLTPLRAVLALRLLPLTGDVKAIVAVAGDEFFHELGLAGEFDEVLESFSNDDAQSTDDRFWALDALAFERLMQNDTDGAAIYLQRMAQLAAATSADVNAQARIATKQLSVLGAKKNLDQARRVYREVKRTSTSDDEAQRVLDYIYALVLYDCARFEEAEKQVVDLTARYLRGLGVTEQDLIGITASALAERIGYVADQQDTMKHIGDCWALLARCRQKQQKTITLELFQAEKFYEVAHAATSFIRTGQDLVDQILDVLGDPHEARNFMETAMLPAIHGYNLLGHLVPVSAQYAVILAYCGEIEAAKRTLDGLIGFRDALPELARGELDNQIALVNEIEVGRVRIAPKEVRPGRAFIVPRR